MLPRRELPGQFFFVRRALLTTFPPMVLDPGLECGILRFRLVA